MPVIERNDGEAISKHMPDGAGLVHTHYGSGGYRAAICLHQDPDDDDEYDGEPFECPVQGCYEKADYADVTGDKYSYHYDPNTGEYVCDYNGCGWSHEMESQVKRHYTMQHKNQEDS